MSGLYIHIPFCEKKCVYCDFFSGNQLYLVDSYIDSLVKEIADRKSYLGDESLETIYFGGGTPSLLSPFQIEKIVNEIRKKFSLVINPEITFECNPENVNSFYLNDLYTLGINRISLGVQFLSDDLLYKYNRNHSIAHTLSALETCSLSNISNLSVDIIYAVPDLSDKDLLYTLNELTKFEIKHVSAYSLTVSKNSRLYWKVLNNEIEEVEEDIFLTQYHLVNNFLREKGFIHYEISNYGLEGFFSKHNLSYWNQTPYLGVGVSAHSYNIASRRWNSSNIKKYSKESQVDFFEEQLTEIQKYNEFIFLNLRTFQGISEEYVKINFDKKIFSHFEKRIANLRKYDHFLVRNKTYFPKESDLLLADYLAKELIL